MYGTAQPGLKLAKRQVGNLTIFDLQGDFDSRTAATAKERIRAAIEEGSDCILVNLEGVHYIDSAGPGSLVSALKAISERGGVICLSCVTDQVRMVIELTRLDRVFTVYDSVETAIARLT